MIDRRIIVVVLAVACGVAGAAAQQSRDTSRTATTTQISSGTATISGRVVVDGATATPARRVRVTLTHVDGKVAGQTTTTDDNGAFAFRNVPAGQFELQAFKNGYLRASYGASRPDRAGTPINVKDGAALTSLDMKIVRGGVITGVVRDGEGRPVPGVTVRMLRLGYHPDTGEATLSLPPSSTVNDTDDRGEYRAYGLPPGGYLVMAAPLLPSSPQTDPRASDIRRLSVDEVQQAMQSARATPTPAGTVPGATTVAKSAAPPALVNYAPVFYPAATEMSAASPITLGAGEERTGVDITLQLMQTAVISGTVTHPSGTLPPSVFVSLQRATPQASMPAGLGFGGGSSNVARDGSYTIGSVAPGTYLVKAMTGTGRGAVPNTATESAIAEVHVSGNDLNVPLTLQPGVPINGRVVFEGAQPTPDELQSLTISLVPFGANGQPVARGGGKVGADGNFTFAGVIPDAYQVLHAWNAASARDKWSLKASVANGRDAFESPLRVNANEPVNWTLTFTDTPATLTGTFQDRSGRAAIDYYILVFPADRAQWTPGSRRIRATRPATDGAFTIKGLPPGDYLLGALTDLVAGEWHDPTLLEQLSATSITITLRDGATTTQDVRIGG